MYSFSNKRDRTQLAVGVSKPYTYILGGVEPIQSISPKTYQDIIETMYYEYWYTWYEPFLSPAELGVYKGLIDKNFELIKKALMSFSSSMPVLHSSCSYSNESADISRLPIPTKKQLNYPHFLLLVPIVILLPLVIIWGYSKILVLFGMPLSSISTIAGSIISAIITSLTTLYIARKKL